MHRVEIAALDPGFGHPGLLHALGDHLVGVDYQTVGRRDVAADEYAGEALAGTVLDAVA